MTKDRGRPSAYKKEYATIAKKMCEMGATVPELAEAFDVSTVTVHAWANKHEAFLNALSLGREVPDNRVERSLYERACGYSHPDVDIRVINNEVVKTEIVKHYPPDTKACLAWLYNRRPKDWHPNPEGELDATKVSEVISKLIDKLPS